MITSSGIFGLVLAVLAVVAAYQIGLAQGRRDGFAEGKQEGHRAGTKRGYAVGYDRGKWQREQEENPGDRQSKRSGCGLLILLAVVLTTTWLFYQST